MVARQSRLPATQQTSDESVENRAGQPCPDRRRRQPPVPGLWTPVDHVLQGWKSAQRRARKSACRPTLPRALPHALPRACPTPCPEPCPTLAPSLAPGLGTACPSRSLCRHPGDGKPRPGDRLHRDLGVLLSVPRLAVGGLVLLLLLVVRRFGRDPVAGLGEMRRGATTQ